jgi:hypothetical protein
MASRLANAIDCGSVDNHAPLALHLELCAIHRSRALSAELYAKRKGVRKNDSEQQTKQMHLVVGCWNLLTSRRAARATRSSKKSKEGTSRGDAGSAFNCAITA